MLLFCMAFNIQSLLLRDSFLENGQFLRGLSLCNILYKLLSLIENLIIIELFINNTFILVFISRLFH